MKKFLSIVLVCALTLGTFTQCVKDDESASVTNIRNQKAEQLKSLATLNNAQAEAAKILAEADAKIKNAEAAYRQALADAEKLQNEMQQIAIDKAKATLALEIEAAKLKAEAAVKTAQAQLEVAKASLIAAMDNVSEAEKARINKLLNSANNTLSNLNNTKTNLVAIKSTRLEVEYELVDLKLVNEQLTMSNNNEIAYNKATVAELSKLSTKDKEEAKKAMDAASIKLTPLGDVYDKAHAMAVSLQSKFSEYLDYNKGFIRINYDYNENRYTVGANVCKFLKFALNPYYDYAKYIEILYEPRKNIEFKYDNGEVGSTYTGGYYYVSNVKKDILNADIEEYTRYVAIATTNLKEVEKVLADKMATDEYKALVKAVANAKKEFADAKTSEEQQIANDKINIAQNNLVAYTANEEQSVVNAEGSLKDKVYYLDYIKELLASLTTDAYAFYVKSLEEAKVVSNKYAAAKIEFWKAKFNYKFQQKLFENLEYIYNNLKDYPQAILDINRDIAELEEENAMLVAGANAKEATISVLDSQIAELESRIKILEKMYNDYKVQIDALVNAK
ncbi:MAG: hypothetical protein RR183_09435 [Bacteroidales bacterium]